MPEIFKPRLSFINEETMLPSTSSVLYIMEDKQFGLGEPADSGYLVNDGPGALTVINSDDGKHKSKPMTVRVGETAVWEHEDDEVVHTLFLTADALGVNYRSRFARGKHMGDGLHEREEL